MTGSLNFSNLSAAAAVRPTTAVQRTVTPPPPSETAKPAPSAPPQTSKPGGGVHMAAEEMETHVAEALAQSPAFEGDQAPLIDPAHLDEMPEPEFEADLEAETAETEENEEIEGEGEVEEPESKEIEAAETEEAEEESESGEKGESESESEQDSPATDSDTLARYLASEGERYLREKGLQAQRFVYLAGPAERSRKAQVAAVLEVKLGGLAPVLPGMAGDFIGLSGAFKGLILDHIGVAPNQAFQAQAFKQALLNHLKAPGIDRVLLDLEYVPPLQRPALLALLKTPQAHPTWVYLSSSQIQGLG
ncbi:MAG: hypothetical protein AB7I41_14465 [Candidatus Sericytochromatia bacterium]